MGFAKLHFENNGTITVGNVIRDIVGVLAGDYTTTGQLQAATPALSQIYNSAGRGNWTKLYPSTNTNTVPQVLSAPCVGSGATKYIRITSQGANSLDTPGNTTSADGYQYSTAADKQGICLQSVVGATSETSVTSPSPIHRCSTVATIAAHNMITGNFIWLSWSSRHCAIIGNSQGSGNDKICLSGAFEFNETSVYDYRNSAPVVHLQLFDNSFDIVTANAQSIGVSNTVNQSSVVVLNHYRPDTGVTTDTFNLTANLVTGTHHPISSNNAVAYPQFFGKSATGLNTVYLQPMFWHQHQIGIPHQYISDLCKIYRTQPGIGVAGDFFTVGSDTYAYFTLQNPSYAVAILRA